MGKSTPFPIATLSQSKGGRPLARNRGCARLLRYYLSEGWLLRYYLSEEWLLRYYLSEGWLLGYYVSEEWLLGYYLSKE